MRSITSLLAAGLLACSMSAIAADENATEGRSSGNAAKNEGSVVRDGTPVAEYGNECAWGLANGKHVQTNCSINMTGSNGKTYCFSSDQAMTSFMKDPSRNMSRSKETFGRS